MERFGYFDERFFCYGEEAEWCWRMERCGLTSAVCPDSLVIHKRFGSDRNGNALYYLVRNRFIRLESKAQSERRRAGWRILYDAAVLSEMARREKDLTSWLALAAALDDAARGHFGQRSTGRLPLRAFGRLIGWWAFAHVYDKWRALRNQPPGFGEPVVFD
jgi:GT2 family glycosyltransferase